MALAADNSETGVAVQALSAARVSSIITDIETDDSTAGRVIRQHFVNVRDALLRAHPWNFASADAEIAAVDDPKPAFRFAAFFELPTDCVAVRSINDCRAGREQQWKVVRGRYIATSLPAPLQVTYTAQVEDPGAWDPLFRQGFILELAAAIAPQLATDDHVIEACIAKARDWRAEALPADSGEGTADEPDEYDIILARY